MSTTALLRSENTTLLKELKQDRANFREGTIGVREAGKCIGFANATSRSIKTGLDIERFDWTSKVQKKPSGK